MSIIMEIEVSQIHPSQQDMELIDILWRQDIDLGARREVFDYSHRQKENELQRQRELEEEKRLHLLREQEKAFLAQLQLDEETGEYIPRPPTGDTPQSAAPPLEVTQNVNFTEDGDSMSFDECMQLLAETFPLVESIEDISTCLDTAVVPASSSNHIMMSPKQPPTPQTLLSPAPIPAERGSPELEQAWMELLSLPELQNCLTMQMENTPEPTTYLPEESPNVEDANYTFYPMPNVTNLGPNTVDNCPTNFINTFEAAFPTMVKAEQLSPVMVNANLGTDSFCDAIYTVPILVKKESSDDQGVMKQKESSTLPELPKKPPLKPMDIPCPSPRDAFERCKQETMGEVHESDSGVSLNTSPNSSSPEKSLYDDGSFGYSDTDMEELDINPGSAESDYSEMFSLNFQPDDFQLKSSQKHQPGKEQEKRPKQYKTKPIEEVGRSDAPFTKDKQKGRFEVRLSRDEQRAKTLQIPFSVDMIINLPVDDFNEMMSKHQLNEAQLALVRDIRRRGKNKVAAQNCRKRKMENIVGLEYELDSLKEEKEQLLEEKSQNSSSLRKMKQQLSSLYLEVFSMLRDEEGRPYSPSHYSLQQTTDGSVFLVPRNKKTITKSKEHKRASTD